MARKKSYTEKKGIRGFANIPLSTDRKKQQKIANQGRLGYNLEVVQTKYKQDGKPLFAIFWRKKR